MPMRIMGYDYGAYKKQYDNNAAKYKNGKGLSSDEFLSKMRKTDKFIPVITAVIYYGERSWDGAVSLHGMLDIPKQFSRYVNDYKMILIGFGIIVLGFILMMGGGSDDPNEFNYAIFS